MRETTAWVAASLSWNRSESIERETASKCAYEEMRKARMPPVISSFLMKVRACSGSGSRFHAGSFASGRSGRGWDSKRGDRGRWPGRTLQLLIRDAGDLKEGGWGIGLSPDPFVQIQLMDLATLLKSVATLFLKWL